MFGISKNVKSQQVEPCTPDLFSQAVDNPETKRICAELAALATQAHAGEISKEEYDERKAALKKLLQVLTPHATFLHGRRLSSEAVPSGISMYDIDHLPNPREYWEMKNEELRMKKSSALENILLAHITPSTEGLRLFFIIPGGMNLEQAQQWMSRELGDANYDGCVKDLARCSFVVPREYILFMDEERLFAERVEDNFLDADLADLADKNFNGANEDKKYNEANEAMETNKKENLLNPQNPRLKDNLAFKGIPYADIIREWFRQNGGEPCPGERNDKLHRLACHLRYIADNDEALLLQIMPTYGLKEEEMRGLIHSACTGKFCSLPKKMREVLEAVGVGRDNSLDADWADLADKNFYAENEPLDTDKKRNPLNPHNPRLKNENHLPPVMPLKLPTLIELLLSRTPDIYKAAVAHAVFPSLAAHLWKTKFRYIDNKLHEATLMNVLMAGTGAGKDCITEPIDHIMADIRQRDAVNLERERQWKQEVNSKGANKDKRLRPEGLVIQEIDADMTNPAFVMRMAEADEHFLYTKLNEIEGFNALRGGGAGNQQFHIMCLAFDPNNRYGQTRVGTQSVTEKVCIRFNWNASTTIKKGQRYFRSVLTDGPISRINFCTIAEREIGADMPIYGTYDEAFDEALRPYIERLTGITGEVECPEAYYLAQELREECAKFARLSQSRVYENLSFRALVIAWLKACVLYVANGCRWEAEISDFVRWSLRYDLWCKMQFFGEAIEREEAHEDEGKRRNGPRNMLELLPERFNYQQAVNVRRQEGKNVGGTRDQLYHWVKRGYIRQTTDDSYEKVA